MSNDTALCPYPVDLVATRIEALAQLSHARTGTPLATAHRRIADLYFAHGAWVLDSLEARYVAPEAPQFAVLATAPDRAALPHDPRVCAPNDFDSGKTLSLGEGNQINARQGGASLTLAPAPASGEQRETA